MANEETRVTTIVALKNPSGEDFSFYLPERRGQSENGGRAERGRV